MYHWHCYVELKGSISNNIIYQVLVSISSTLPDKVIYEKEDYLLFGGGEVARIFRK